MEFLNIKELLIKTDENLKQVPQTVHLPRHADVPLLPLFPLVCMKSKHYVSTDPSSNFLPFTENNSITVIFFPSTLAHKLDEIVHNYVPKFSKSRHHVFQEQKGST